MTFQREDPLSQCVHDVLQCRLVRHIEEVLLIRVAGNELDFLQEGFRVDSSTVVVTQDLEQSEARGFQVPERDMGTAGSEGPGTRRDGLTAMAYMVMLSLSLSVTACSSCGLS